MLSAGNAKELFSPFDIICDCTDNAAARILCDAVCKELQKPLVYAIVRDWQGYITVLHHKRGIGLSEVFDPAALLESERGTARLPALSIPLVALLQVLPAQKYLRLCWVLIVIWMAAFWLSILCERCLGDLTSKGQKRCNGVKCTSIIALVILRVLRVYAVKLFILSLSTLKPGS